VLVGHLGPDGIVRIIFPTDPTDNGLVQGGKTYRLPEISAGYYDMYRWRNANYGLFRGPAARTDSYDGGAGYIFVIAAWRPMRFDRFSDNGQWDSFEVADDAYLRDPRPAIYELATLLTGENREAYTVKFASYFSTTSLYSSYFRNSAFASTFCMGDEPLGYSFYGPTDPWGNAVFSPRVQSGYFYSGGLRYAYRYDSTQGCYRSYMVPIQTYATGGVPVPRFVPKDTSSAGSDSSGNAPPRVVPVERPRIRENPIQRTDATPVSDEPEYRRRGLVAQDATDRAARHDRPSVSGTGFKPPIQEMLNRRREMSERNSTDAEAYRPATPRTRQGGAREYTPPNNDNPRLRSEPTVRQSEPSSSGARPEPPRAEPVRVEVRPPEPARPVERPAPAESRPPESRPESRPSPEPSARPITP
jgi:hypothetical protein